MAIIAILAGTTSFQGQDARAQAIINASSAGPAILFMDVDSGPKTGGPGNQGIPISIFGKGFGAAQGNSRVTIGGVEVSSYLVWGSGNAHNPGLDMIVVQPGPNVTGGPVVVTVGGQASNADHSFTVRAGNIYYIATGGSDSAACTVEAPCATVLHVAGDVMHAGDTVLVRGGTYLESEVWIRGDRGQSGALGQPKVIKAYPEEQVYFTNAARSFIIDADYITVSGFNLRNGKSLDIAAWASARQKGDEFIDNTFQGTFGWDAIHVEGDDHLVAGNVCDMSDSTVGTEGHCYYVSQGSNNRLLYNTASGTPGYGIHLYDEVRSSADFQRIIRNVLIEGNILKNSTERSGLIIAMADCSGGTCYGNYIDGVTVRNNIFTGNNFVGVQVQGISRNIKIYNNTFYQNGRQGLNIDNSSNINGVDVRNNLFYQSANPSCTSNCSWYSLAHLQSGSLAQNVTINTNGYGPSAASVVDENENAIPAQNINPVTGLVQFASPATLDLHLLAGSAAIDKGLALAEVRRDYDGTARPQGSAYDLGAFEYFDTYTPPVLMYLPWVTHGT